MFPYYGSKTRLSKHYPPPQYKKIIEPFAGSAAYSLHYADREVILCDRDPVIAEVWRYLIAASPEQIRALPLLKMEESLNDSKFDQLTKAEKYLIGFHLGVSSKPRKLIIL